MLVKKCYQNNAKIWHFLHCFQILWEWTQVLILRCWGNCTTGRLFSWPWLLTAHSSKILNDLVIVGVWDDYRPDSHSTGSSKLSTTVINGVHVAAKLVDYLSLFVNRHLYWHAHYVASPEPWTDVISQQYRLYFSPKGKLKTLSKAAAQGWSNGFQ